MAGVLPFRRLFQSAVDRRDFIPPPPICNPQSAIVNSIFNHQITQSSMVDCH
jgi:hypothetical protein